MMRKLKVQQLPVGVQDQEDEPPFPFHLHLQGDAAASGTPIRLIQPHPVPGFMRLLDQLRKCEALEFVLDGQPVKREVEARTLLEGMERGDFYASTGVELADYGVSSTEMTVAVRQSATSKYRIQFIGRGGKLLKEAIASPATYEFQRDEGYVRAKVIESNGQLAWCQPTTVSRKTVSGSWLLLGAALGIAAIIAPRVRPSRTRAPNVR